MTIQVTVGEYVKKNVSRAFDIPYWFQICAYDKRPFLYLFFKMNRNFILVRIFVFMKFILASFIALHAESINLSWRQSLHCMLRVSIYLGVSHCTACWEYQFILASVIALHAESINLSWRQSLHCMLRVSIYLGVSHCTACWEYQFILASVIALHAESINLSWRQSLHYMLRVSIYLGVIHCTACWEYQFIVIHCTACWEYQFILASSLHCMLFINLSWRHSLHCMLRVSIYLGVIQHWCWSIIYCHLTIFSLLSWLWSIVTLLSWLSIYLGVIHCTAWLRSINLIWYDCCHLTISFRFSFHCCREWSIVTGMIIVIWLSVFGSPFIACRESVIHSDWYDCCHLDVSQFSVLLSLLSWLWSIVTGMIVVIWLSIQFSVLLSLLSWLWSIMTGMIVVIWEYQFIFGSSFHCCRGCDP